ncbi:MAG: hypothetical protein WAO71_03610 [Gallionella sp.]
MGDNKTAQAVLAGAAGIGIGSLLNSRRAKASESSGSPMVVEGETVNLNPLISAINDLIITLRSEARVPVSSSTGSTVIQSEDSFRNYDGFTTGQLVCTMAGRGFKLPPIPIPKNKQLVIKGLPGNAGWVYIGVQQAQAQSTTVSYPLLANEGIGLSITNAKLVWVSAQIVNDGVAFIVEQA